MLWAFYDGSPPRRGQHRRQQRSAVSGRSTRLHQRRGAEVILHRHQRRRRTRGERFKQRVHGAIELRERDHLADDPELQRGPGVDPRHRVDHEGQRLARHARHQRGDRQRRRKILLHLGEAETRHVGGDGDVAGARHGTAEPVGNALYSADHGLRRARDRIVNVEDRLQRIAQRERGWFGGAALGIAAAAEIRAGRAQHDHLGVGRRRVPQRRIQRAQHVGIEKVAFGCAVDGNGRDRPIAASSDRIGHAASSLCS